MTQDTYEILGQYIGKSLPNSAWIDLISESYHVSRSVAKEMLHAMYVMKILKKHDELYER